MAFILNKTKKTSDAGSATEKTEKTKSEGASPSKFLKSGTAAKKMMDQAEAEQAAKSAKMDKAWRFWLKPGEDANITFLDGALNENTGILDILYANEHTLKIAGKFENIMCIEDDEPCPLCSAGEKRNFVGYLSILDHRGYEYEKDGKKIQVPAAKRLLVAKQGSLKQLVKMAEKRPNGLVGVTYEASRTGDKKANIGDLFDFLAVHELEEIATEFGEELAKPLDYNEELTAITFTPEDMKKMGIGTSTTSFGSTGGKSADDVDDDAKPW